MDAASQRGIDDIREIRERVVLQPVEGRYKVYILDEAHQLTDAAFNALLKLIEEPPPHLVFVFCTTDVSKMLPTVRSRCQTFVFSRPRLPDLIRKLRRIADAEGIEAPDAALALVARGARGAYRDAESTLDQLAAATGNQVTVQSVLQLLGAVEEEALFRLCDLVVDKDTAGALQFLEDLAEQGQDLGRLVTDLLEHLRHLLLVQHMGEVPDSLPVTEETRERLRAQANQLPGPTVIRLCDLLAVAVDDMRQGGDPRLPLELALIKVTRPGADLDRESLSFRIEQLEQRGPATVAVADTGGSRAAAGSARAAAARARPAEGCLAALGDPGGRGAVGAHGVRAARGPAGGNRRRHTDRRVSGRSLVPPPDGRGAEERHAARRCALRGDGPQVRPRVRGRGEGGNRARTGAHAERGGACGGDQAHVRRPGGDARMSGPGGMDINKMMQQVQQMQTEMARVQEELATQTVEASAGGGAVKVTANGSGEIERIEIAPEAIDPDDPELLADMVTGAVNEALRAANDLAQSRLGGLTGGLGLPGL